MMLLLLMKCKSFQNQPSRGVLGKRCQKICSKSTGEHLCQSLISIKLLWNYLSVQNNFKVLLQCHYLIYEGGLNYLKFINSLVPNSPFLYPLKMSENLQFSGVFREQRKGALKTNELILLLCLLKILIENGIFVCGIFLCNFFTISFIRYHHFHHPLSPLLSHLFPYARQIRLFFSITLRSKFNTL